MQFSTYSEWSNYLSTHFLEVLEEAATKVTEAFKRDVSPNVPFLFGELKGSIDIQIAVSANSATITLIWDTPYAQRQYFEHTEYGEWDIKTWEQHKETYTRIIAKIIQEKLGG